jgi:hypothetical protein
MSASITFVQLPSDLLIDREVSATELRLYAILMDLGYKGMGFSQAGTRYLAKLCNCHEKTVAKSLKHLEELGWLRIVRIGLNRNNKIHCLRTVRKDKNVPIKSRSQMGSPSTNRKKNKKNIEVVTTPDAFIDNKTTTKNQEEIRHRDEVRASKADNYQERTKALQDGLQQSTRQTSWNMWLKDLVIVGNDEGLSISVGKDTDFELEWIEKHYSHLIETVAGEEVLLTL